jgi:hypothetical protein
MKRSPFVAQRGQFGRQSGFDAVHIGQAEPITLAQNRWPIWALQYEYRFAIRPFYMDMRGSMIIWVDDHAQAIESVDGWHGEILA